MSPGIVISIVVIVLLLIGGFTLYKRAMKKMALDDETRPLNGARLTSERLRELPAPPWRFVHEIGESALGGVDHVVIGSCGIIAVATSVIDRPTPSTDADPHQLAASALPRSAVDDLATRAGLNCKMLARVYWGKPQPGSPAAVDLMHATVGVQGQQLNEWLQSLPTGVLTPAQIDLAWQTIATGIGRPDPLS